MEGQVGKGIKDKQIKEIASQDVVELPSEEVKEAEMEEQQIEKRRMRKNKQKHIMLKIISQKLYHLFLKLNGKMMFISNVKIETMNRKVQKMTNNYTWTSCWQALIKGKYDEQVKDCRESTIWIFSIWNYATRFL